MTINIPDNLETAGIAQRGSVDFNSLPHHAQQNIATALNRDSGAIRNASEPIVQEAVNAALNEISAEDDSNTTELLGEAVDLLQSNDKQA